LKQTKKDAFLWSEIKYLQLLKCYCSERECVLTEKEHGVLVRTVTANLHYINAFYYLYFIKLYRKFHKM